MRSTEEWLIQSEYDLETAEFMFSGGRYFYSVFMCHLSIEKMVKGIYTARLKELPPKNHNLVFFVESLHLKLDNELENFISELNSASVATRYPDNLSHITKEFSEIKTKEILEKTKLVHSWLKKQLMQ